MKHFSPRRLAVALALVPVLGGLTAASAQAEINPGVYRGGASTASPGVGCRSTGPDDPGEEQLGLF